MRPISHIFSMDIDSVKNEIWSPSLFISISKEVEQNYPTLIQ